jgi:NAD(P)-dependent dehydrogenase (short-subunit alcohol dehydrogenase family)
MARLEGKVALITGAGEGMGRAAALLFAREGAAVGVLDVDPDRAEATAAAIRGDGGRAVSLVADVSSDDDVREAVARVVGEFGLLNVLYNNAGVWLAGDGATTELPLDVWERTIAVNLNGVFLCCRHGIPELVKAGGGSVINTGSPVAIRPAPVYDAYTASKGGVISLTRAIAQYYGPLGVRANVLMPGNTETAMTRQALEDPSYREVCVRESPLGRLGQPEDVAYGALYLASDESSFVTGTIHWVDGGWLLGPQAQAFSAEGALAP